MRLRREKPLKTQRQYEFSEDVQLSNTNYYNWKFRVEILLEKKGVKNVLTISKIDYENLTTEEKAWQKRLKCTSKELQETSFS